MALSRCTTLARDVFLADVVGRRHLHTPARELGGGFRDLFSARALEEMLAGGLRTSSLRLVRSGVETPLDTGGGPDPAVAAGEAGFADTDRLRTALAQGHTLIVRSLHRLHPPLRRFAHDLSADLGHPVSVNAFVTPPHSTGVDLHFDVQDVLVLQIAGHKTWRLRTAPLPDPLPTDAWFDVTSRRRQQMLDASGPLEDLVLGPGDTLYFPRGTFHAPETGDELSIHLTFAITKITRADVLAALARSAAADPWLRQDVTLEDLEDNPSAARDLLVQLAGSLAAAAKSADPADLLWQVRRTAWAGSPPEPSPVLPDTRPPARYRLREGAHYRLEQDGSAYTVTVGTRHVRLPGALGPVLTALRHEGGLDPGELDSLVGPDTAAQAARALVDIGLLLPVSAGEPA